MAGAVRGRLPGNLTRVTESGYIVGLECASICKCCPRKSSYISISFWDLHIVTSATERERAGAREREESVLYYGW